VRSEATARETPPADGPRSLAEVFARISAEMCENVGDVCPLRHNMAE
jgi:hypothetical protein